MELHDYFLHDCSIVLVFDFMPSGLWEVLHDINNPPTIPHIKTYVRMLLKGVSYLHENGIMHRVRIQLHSKLYISIATVCFYIQYSMSKLLFKYWRSREGMLTVFRNF